jgi:hypothetical protein
MAELILTEEMAEVEAEKNRQRPNCRGSLLYWMAERTSEYHASKRTLLEFLKGKCQKVEEVQVGDIAVWQDPKNLERNLHTGLVEKLVSGVPLVKSRLGPHEHSEIRSLPFDEVLPTMGFYHETVLQYYRPNIL